MSVADWEIEKLAEAYTLEEVISFMFEIAKNIRTYHINSYTGVGIEMGSVISNRLVTCKDTTAKSLLTGLLQEGDGWFYEHEGYLSGIMLLPFREIPLHINKHSGNTVDRWLLEWRLRVGK